MKCCILSKASYVAETWTLGKMIKKSLGSFKILEKGGEGQLHRSCEKCIALQSKKKGTSYVQ
jgi:hypothetical protein